MKYREWAMVRREELCYTILPSNKLYIKINAEWTQLNNNCDVETGEPVSKCSDPQEPHDLFKLIAFANSSEELWETAKILGACDQDIEIINQSDREKRPEENPTPQNRAIEYDIATNDQNAATVKPLSLVWTENEFCQKNFSIVPTVYVFVKRSNDSKYRNVYSNEKIKFGEEVKVLMGMTNKTMKFVIFGDSYEKLNDVAKLCDRTAKPKRIKFVKRLTFSPPKRETAKIKIVSSSSSNATKKPKQKKENFSKKKTKSTPREHAEEDGDNFFLPKIMRVENNFEKTIDDIDAVTTQNIHTNKNDGAVHNTMINLSDSNSEREIAFDTILNDAKKNNREISDPSPLTAQVCREIVREELHNFVPLLIEGLNNIPKDADQHHIPPMDNDDMVTMEGVRLHYSYVAEAQSSETMRKRANAIMKGMWDKEERLNLVVKKNKRTPPDKREVTQREYEKIRKICLALQNNRNLPQRPDKDNLINLRQWVGDLLKNKNYLKRKHDRNLEHDQAIHPENSS